MRKIEIALTDEQYLKLTNEIKRRAETNLQEETFSGFDIVLSVIEGNISWLKLEMGTMTPLGEVDWKIV